jgi:hypothetical protein
MEHRGPPDPTLYFILARSIHDKTRGDSVGIEQMSSARKSGSTGRYEQDQE